MKKPYAIYTNTKQAKIRWAVFPIDDEDEAREFANLIEEVGGHAKLTNGSVEIRPQYPVQLWGKSDQPEPYMAVQAEWGNRAAVEELRNWLASHWKANLRDPKVYTWYLVRTGSKYVFTPLLVFALTGKRRTR